MSFIIIIIIPKIKTTNTTTTTSSNSNINNTTDTLIRQILISDHCLSCYYGTAHLLHISIRWCNLLIITKLNPFSFPAIQLRFLKQIMVFFFFFFFFSLSSLLSSPAAAVVVVFLHFCSVRSWQLGYRISTLSNNEMPYTTELNY